MAQNHTKSENNNPQKPTILSQSHSISTIRNHNKIISFMPKFLLKTFHRRKPSITGSKHFEDPCTKNDEEKVGFIKRLAKHFQRNDQLMPLSRKMSHLFVNKKEEDQKQVSKKTRSKNYNKFGVTENGGKISRVNSVVKTEENEEPKGGLRIRRIIKIKFRKRDQKGRKGLELCKKKIMMGERCRPLHGSLRYDDDGVLVPRNLPDT